MTAKRIVVLPGDGIGPEVTAAARRVLEAAARRFDVALAFETHPIGGAALAGGGDPFPAPTRAACLAADAVLLGAVGDPAWDSAPREKRPETGLLALRKSLGAYANVRPARLFPGLEDAGPLKREVVAGLDLVIVRELTGGLYFGTPREVDVEAGRAVNTLPYSRAEVARVAEVAFRLAAGRRGRVTSVDKANVLETSQLWRAVVGEVAAKHPGVALDHQYVDSCAMALVLSPARFDVLVTENLFGDILSDEVGALVGSLGLLPSASLGGGPGLYEPVHGSAPPLAGKDVANPVGAIGSAAMLLRFSLGRPDAADAVDRAIADVLGSGARTADLAPAGAPGAIGTEEMGARIAEAVLAAQPVGGTR